ncbi:glycoside hydrolase family 3 C-terminal domain-containing protein [Nonomuraea sp. NPDC005650]|uniref:beta-glucosidase family protein n=1 Tax=Nonomuraea sp. NPDC005650 TaxID=3157045 RepID=UPI0033ADCB9E
MSADPRLHELCAGLTLEEKVRLLTGRDFWSTHGLERIGLRPVVFSDGPSGIRGQAWDERDPSVSLPCGTALAASWDRELAMAYGAVLAGEARRKGVDVVLGPTINMHRTPGGGRSFEAFSEDPVLTGDLAAAYVEGIQRHGVGATPKHYLCNDFETDRYTVDVRVDERSLREVYLAAFEKSVTQAGAWLVMSSYNSVNGATASENDLLETPLNDEWGFDGVVVGDWTGVRSLRSARFSQDLVMPGPDGPWGEALVKAVEAGEIDETVVDRKVLRLLGLAARLGRLDGFAPAAPRSAPQLDPTGFARSAAAAGSVLLENRGLLPVDPGRVRRILVTGQTAQRPLVQGGGSATVVPAHVITPLEGVRAAFPGAQVEYRPGPLVENGLDFLPPNRTANPVTGGDGVHVRFTDAAGTVIHTEDRHSTNLVWFGGEAPIEDTATVDFATVYRPETSGRIRFGVSSVGAVRVEADGVVVFDEEIEPVGTDLGAALLAAPVRAFEIEAVAGEPVELRLTHAPRRGAEGLRNALGFRFGLLPPDLDDDRLIADAVTAADEADLVVVVVGSNKELEAEGEDRRTLTLPGRQDDLVTALAAANPATVAIVNCGAPMLLPWAGEVGAVLQVWFGGQEMGHAVGDLLTGRAEPGGRLPSTWPAAEGDVPILAIEPVDGRVDYHEGVHVGYRNWLRLGRTPGYPFGHGLGYTTWSLDRILAPAALSPASDETVTVRVGVTNTGGRAGKQVVQVYAERAGSAVDRPAIWLAGFASVLLEAGESAVVDVVVPIRAFAHWDSGWQYEPGEFALTAGFSSADRRLTTTVRVA